MIRTALLPLALGALLVTPVAAKDSLGVYSGWAAFRDERPMRCYAIAQPARDAASGTSASIANWPKSAIRGQLHLRLSREVRNGASPTLRIGATRFALVANGRNAWAKDGRMDAAIVAAIRSGRRMSVSALDTNGRRFTDRYALEGAASAIDAATVGCASV